MLLMFGEEITDPSANLGGMKNVIQKYEVTISKSFVTRHVCIFCVLFVWVQLPIETNFQTFMSMKNILKRSRDPPSAKMFISF